MSEVPSEQINSQNKGAGLMFNQQTTADSASSSKPAQDDDTKAPLPKGVVLGKDGKPCRTCTSVASWRALTKQADLEKTSSSNSTSKPTFNSSVSKMTASMPAFAAAATPSPSATPSECPPDVEELGRSTWTLLHSMAATYPEKANTEHQDNMRGFLKFFSKLYPCWVCADDFQTWMARNQPKLSSRKEFGWWMCEAHNEVNRKLGKKEFDCRFWEERWRTGWKDGRCD
ncbi:FAD dependent sulfhydryl oxidase Erv1 [Penicillium paradoxum]|uniref:FAD dependent sulfhydryl oxidase Erv1 n=1 Tax=Penicillium paradoxum TaxID=176176 RepID=UPI00254777B3|nr:FAD dependent sulfhydryl oxidase Erv1 [Penicillium paradoxum]KAJ5780558.1 FAD dependent sulfhydryl oxidase Erv1 [Penicillium paradoxum]